ncbi:hypothetical protein BD414DRAFT_485871 [Trametes punicea]|nr:hypothetical protein BD414DRAFT_485871 [Trametes punicea]
MSRASSPASASASPAAFDAQHDEHPSRREQSESVQDVAEVSRENSEATPNREDASESASRGTSTSPSAADGASTSTSTPTPEASGSSSAAFSASPASVAAAGTWQAVWSPAHNAYYFYNTVTQETTWVNPLQQTTNAEAGPSNATATADPASTSETTAGMSSSSTTAEIYAAAAAQGIDPALAHLDPSLIAGSTAPGAFTYTAKFNARTGAFARPDARDPTHLSEYERAKRMSEFYFDVNAWEREVEMRKLQEAQEEESRKRKRPTKKDLERFKEKKRQKKLAKTAWLRT